MKHTPISTPVQDALSGKPFILSDRYTQAEWGAALWYARQGDMADLELMIEMDAAHARADSMARHDPAYREGHVSLDLLFDIDAIARAEGSYLPGSCVS